MSPTQQDVPIPDFDRLWEDKYVSRWAEVARRNAYLIEGEGTADDLLQDLWINVWDKKVKGRWNDFASKSAKPDVDAWAAFLLKHYLIDLSRKRQTRPKEWQRGQQLMSTPVKNEGGETDEGATVEDFIGALDRAFDRVESESQFEDLLSKVKDPVINQTLQIMMAHDEPPEELWARIRRETGHSRGYLQEKLKKEPAVVKFFNEISNGKLAVSRVASDLRIASSPPEQDLFD